MNNALRVAVALGFVLLGQAASAAPCAGFIDVDDAVVGASFCKNVEWLKNREITLGCALPNSYCPNDPVI